MLKKMPVAIVDIVIIALGGCIPLKWLVISIFGRSFLLVYRKK